MVGVSEYQIGGVGTRCWYGGYGSCKLLLCFCYVLEDEDTNLQTGEREIQLRLHKTFIYEPWFGIIPRCYGGRRKFAL